MKGKNAFLLIIGLIYLTMLVNGQENRNPLPKDSLNNEFAISINWSKPAQSFTTKNIGFGLGAYHLFISKHTLSLIAGIEYNYTSQFYKYIEEGPNTKLVDRTYYINSLSFPLGLRINIGKRNTFFVETGLFADITIASRQKGTKYSHYYDENNILIIQSAEYNRDAKLSSCVGIYLGMGFKIPVSKFELIIKPEAKAGLNDLNNYGVHTGYIRLSVGIRI